MKNVLFILGLLFVAGLGSAHGYWLEDHEGFENSYDNENRYDVYDYRHGYSYRATQEFYEDKVVIKSKVYSSDSWVLRDVDYGKRASYYVYVPYMKSYDERKCYISAPSNKLFYVKC